MMHPISASSSDGSGVAGGFKSLELVMLHPVEL
jgi:hypothetical protein